MAVRTTLEDVEASFDELIDVVSKGEEVEITRDGRVVARLVPPLPNGGGLRGLFAGEVKSVANDDDLMSTGVHWNAQDPE